MNRTRGQQEMVGFVLIVILVVVGLMVFLIFSLRSGDDEVDSLAVDNMLHVVMKYTTECAVPVEPYYNNVEDLIQSCYENDKCADGKDACEYLNETLQDVLGAMIDTEATIEAYQIDFSLKDSDGISGIEKMPKIIVGNCTGGTVASAQKPIVVDGQQLITRLKVCRGSLF